MLFAFLFSIAIFQELTNVTWDEYFSKKDSLGFAMCFSPSCPHCKRELPNFKNVSNYYSNNNKIILGTVNCSAFIPLCFELGVNGYPTFFTIYHEFTAEILFWRRATVYTAIIDRLIKLDQKCYFKDQENVSIQYPHFEFTFRKDDDESIENAEKAISYSDYYYNTTYRMKYGQENEMTVQIAKGVEVSMKDEFTIDNIADFLREYQQPYFGVWTPRLLDRIKRPKIIFSSDLTANSSEVQKYKEYLKKYVSHYSFHLTSPHNRNFNQQYEIQTSDLPALVFIDNNRTRYSKLMNIQNEKQIEDFLKRSESEREYFDLPNNDVNLAWELCKITIYVILFIVILVLTIVIIYQLYYSKKEFKKKDI